MKTIIYPLLAILTLSICVLSSCDYITGKLPEAKPVAKRYNLILTADSNWTNIPSDITSLSVTVEWSIDEYFDISPLVKFTKLTSLSLDATQTGIKDLSPISTLTNLTNLSLDVHQRWIYDPPVDLSLLTPLKKLETLSLDVGDNIKAESIGMLENLVSLSINTDDLGDISSVSSLTSLRSLQITTKGFAPKSIDAIGSLTGLTGLKLQGNLVYISPLKNLVNLITLDLSHNEINHPEPFSSLTSLVEIDLDYNRIDDIGFVSSLNKLTSLKLNNNKIQDISPLKNLLMLQYLDIGNNQITDISPLSGLHGLETLGLTHNRVRDITVLKSLNRLSTLKLGINQITDVSPLSGITRLKEVFLDNNPFDNNSIKNIMPQLRQRGIKLFCYSLDDYDRLIPLLFTDQHKKGGYFLVNPETSLPKDCYSQLDYLQNDFIEQGINVSSMLEALLERNTQPTMLDIPSSKNEGYVIGNEKIIDDDPDFQCYITISVPVYDAERNILLVYLGWSGGGLMGSGDIYAFSYTNGKLVELAKVTLWVS
jgi:Leucine-rich repeat (LRR) protein